MCTYTLGNALEKVAKPLSKGSAIVGGTALTIMMLIIVVDVVLRNLFSASLTGILEIVEVLLVIVVFSGMAYAEFSRGHVVVDIILNKIKASSKLATLVAGQFMYLIMVIILSWQCWLQGVYLKASNFNSGILAIPLWPFGIMAGILIGIYAFTILMNFIKILDQFIKSETKSYLWLIISCSITFVLLYTAFFPFEFDIGENTMGIMSLIILFTLIFFGLPIGASMAVVGLWGMSYFTSVEGGLTLLGMVSKTVSSNYIWSVGPLFMLMGVLVSACNFSRDLYDTAYKWIGHWKGGLASATLGACTTFAAVVGDSLTGVVTMGKIALPQMNKYNYDTKLSTGCIAVGGSLGILIPPSMGFIVYGLLTEQSIGKLFMAGLIPGALASLSLIGLVTIRCTINPSLGPPGPKVSFKERFHSFYKSWPVFTLFLMVIGGIWLGICTPTEAGAAGAFMVIVLGVILKRLNFSDFKWSLLEGIKLTSVIFFIFIYAIAFTQYLTLTQLPEVLAEFVGGLEFNRYLIISIIMFIYLLMGCVMNALPVLILTLPIVYPTVLALGFDPIWFGVVLVMLVEIGQITPPIGMSVFAMQTVAEDVPMYTIFKGVFPFWCALLLVIVILTIFPQFCLFLPELVMGGG